MASVAIPLAAGAAPLAVLVVGFLTTAALGMPLAFTLALTSFSYLIGIGGVGLIILPIRILGAVDSFVLLAIPFFVFGGALMETAGISERIVQLAVAIVGRVRGGLAMVAVVAELIFSGISGSTAADVSAISSLVIPSMRKAGYSGPESVSVVAAASAMGILVPPCLTMVVLGSLVNLSIVTLFLAGFLPALVLAAALLILIAIRARRQRWPVPPPRASGDLSRAARRAIVPLGLPVLLFGGIFSGAVTVTEAALIAVVYALVAHALMGGFKTKDIVDRLAESGIVTATTLWVLAAASAFAWILVREWVPQGLGEWIADVGAGPDRVHADHRRRVRRCRGAARGTAGAPDLWADPLPHQPDARPRPGALRHRDCRRDGDRVLPAADWSGAVDCGRHRAGGSRRGHPGVHPLSRGAGGRIAPYCCVSQRDVDPAAAAAGYGT